MNTHAQVKLCVHGENVVYAHIETTKKYKCRILSQRDHTILMPSDNAEFFPKLMERLRSKISVRESLYFTVDNSLHTVAYKPAFIGEESHLSERFDK